MVVAVVRASKSRRARAWHIEPLEKDITLIYRVQCQAWTSVAPKCPNHHLEVCDRHSSVLRYAESRIGFTRGVLVEDGGGALI